MPEAPKRMMKTSLVALLLWVVGLIVFALAIAGIAEAQFQFSMHLFIVILVLTIFMGVVSLANCILSKGTQDDYEVNDAEKGAKENAAYEIDAEKKAEPKENGSAETKEQKWVSNYVPYGDYPKGNVVYVKEYLPQDMITELNGEVEIVDENNWKNNYVT